MSVTQDKPSKTWWRIPLRICLIVVVASFVGWALNRSAQSIDRGTTPAGFGLGVIHGAMMPCALPTLLWGRDVSIFASNNSGRVYKLGYTVGVNMCGALFFGFSYWRLGRWKKRLADVPGGEP